jgi:hypothetical protein
LEHHRKETKDLRVHKVPLVVRDRLVPQTLVELVIRDLLVIPVLRELRVMLSQDPREHLVLQVLHRQKVSKVA